MTDNGTENLFETREEASLAAAEAIAERLAARLAAQRGASLVVSGGTTPTRCFEALRDQPLDWARTHVILSDERWVPPDDEDSNERLVREVLLVNGAEPAKLLPVFHSATPITTRCDHIDKQIRQLPFPFACALLGMGEDGHFASLFPDADNLDEGLDVDGERLCMPVTTKASPHPRVSLTLTALSRSDAIVLLIFGEAKRKVYEQARQKGSELPVARLLRQKKAPVNVYWAP